MKNRFNISEEEKKRIKGLHDIKEEDFVSGRGYDSNYTEDGGVESEIKTISTQIESQLKLITGEYASIHNRDGKMRAKFSYTRREFDEEIWSEALNFISSMGFEVLDGTNNYYEANYEREEPAEAVPTIYFR